MAIIIGNTSSKSAGSTDNTTLSHTVDGASNLMVVTIQHSGTTFQTPVVTYDGDSMTLTTQHRNSAVGGVTYIFHLVNPSTGANNIAISISAARTMYLSGIDLGNIDISTPEGNNYGADSAFTQNASRSVEVTAQKDNSIFIDSMWVNDALSQSSGGSQTEIHNVDTIGSSYQAATTAGGYTMSWTYTDDGSDSYTAAEFLEASEADTGNFLMFM